MFFKDDSDKITHVEAVGQFTFVAAEDVVVLDDDVVQTVPETGNNYVVVNQSTTTQEVEEGPSRIRPKGLDRLRWPRYSSTSNHIYLLFSLFVTLGAFVVALYFFIVVVCLDEDGGPKPFKGACFTTDEMRENLCLFSAGRLAFGIICLGQVTIGLITIGQVSVGLIFAFGQVVIGWGYCPIGQIAVSTYTHYAQVAFCLYDFDGAQVGFRFLKCLVDNEDGEEKAYKNC